MVKVNPNDQSGPCEGTIWFDYFEITGAPWPQKKNNIGAIVGGVVGGVSILILLVLLLLFYRRRRLSKDIPVNPCESPHTHQASISHASPVPTHSDHVAPSTKYHIVTSIDQSPIRPNIEVGLSSFMVAPTSPLLMEEVAGSSSPTVIPSSPTTIMQHSDSGRRVVDPVSIVSSSVVELPPAYSPT